MIREYRYHLTSHHHHTPHPDSHGSSQGNNQCKKRGKDQESIQSRTTPDPGYLMGK